jgi:hypothetical protein
MGNMYWTPQNHDKLVACEGFFIENRIFFGMMMPDTEQWDKSIGEFVTKLNRFLPTMRVVNDWENSMGVSRYVLMRNESAEVILGEDDNYAPIYLVIPEHCSDVMTAKRAFRGIQESLVGYLTKKYPNQVFRRKNTWNLELIKPKRRTTT